MLAAGSPAARVPCRRPQSPHRYGTTARQAFGAKLNQKMRNNHTSVSMFIIKRTHKCFSILAETQTQTIYNNTTNIQSPLQFLLQLKKEQKKQILLMKKAPHLPDLNLTRAERPLLTGSVVVPTRRGPKPPPHGHLAWPSALAGHAPRYNIPTQGLIGLIGYSYQQVATSFPEADLQRTSRLSVHDPEKFGDK